MCLRRDRRRLCRNERLWTILVLAGIFYLNLAFLAPSAEKAVMKRGEQKVHGKVDDDEWREKDEGWRGGDGEDNDDPELQKAGVDEKDEYDDYNANLGVEEERREGKKYREGVDSENYRLESENENQIIRDYGDRLLGENDVLDAGHIENDVLDAGHIDNDVLDAGHIENGLGKVNDNGNMIQNKHQNQDFEKHIERENENPNDRNPDYSIADNIEGQGDFLNQGKYEIRPEHIEDQEKANENVINNGNIIAKEVDEREQNIENVLKIESPKAEERSGESKKGNLNSAINKDKEKDNPLENVNENQNPDIRKQTREPSGKDSNFQSQPEKHRENENPKESEAEIPNNLENLDKKPEPAIENPNENKNNNPMPNDDNVKGNEGEGADGKIKRGDPQPGKDETWKKGEDYNGYYNIGETVEGKPVVKVVLLTSQRAGSSFTGELLTSGGGAVYVYEPLFLWRKLLGPGADPRLEEDSVKALGDLLDCRPEVINSWKRSGYSYFKRSGDGSKSWCSNAPLRLLKTIRIRESFAHTWLSHRSDIKVVHLVRDPRGILHSVARGGGLWSKNNRDATLQCTNMEKDMLLQDLGPNRYLRVRYEDLVDRPLEETKRVLTFMGVEMTQEVVTYLHQHTGLGDSSHVQKKYLNTFRDAQFRHDHWKDDMTDTIKNTIERSCQSLMQRLDYLPH